MALFISLNGLQFLLLPISAALGVAGGLFLPRAGIAQRRPIAVFWLSIAGQFALLTISGIVGGEVLARIIFTFMMGFFACAIKLIK